MSRTAKEYVVLTIGWFVITAVAMGLWLALAVVFLYGL